MKALGIVRRIDDLGRIVIPKEIRRNLHINEGDSMEFFVQDGDLVLHPLEAVVLSHKLRDLADEFDYNSLYAIASKLRVMAREMEEERE